MTASALRDMRFANFGGRFASRSAVRAWLLFFPSEAQENPSSNDAQPEEATLFDTKHSVLVLLSLFRSRNYRTLPPKRPTYCSSAPSAL